MSGAGKLAIHLWVYNHPFVGISDQVDFFVTALKQHGYTVSVGRQPSRASLNVVIENFSERSKKVLMDFCRTTRKRVAVIMTEHLDFDQGVIFIHGAPLWSENDYMHPTTQFARIRSLIDCLPYLRCLFVLGDLPELRNMSILLPGIDVRSIPFPKLEFVSNENVEMLGLVSNDTVFTGFMTDYRINIQAALSAQGISVVHPQKFVSRKKRDAMNRSAKLILNIPQRADWHWLSLMRVIAALRSGRATISLGTNDGSRISACCSQLDMRDPDWIGRLKLCIDDWQAAYLEGYRAYSAMAAEFEEEKAFPHDLLEYWSITDQAPS